MFGVVERADEAIDGLLAVDLGALSPEELADWVVQSHRLQQRIDAVACRATAAFDRHGDPQGAISTAAYLAWRCRVPKAQARAELANGRALRAMPAAAAMIGSRRWAGVDSRPSYHSRFTSSPTSRPSVPSWAPPARRSAASPVPVP